MKRIISLILAFVMLFASLVLTLSSCGEDEETKNKGTQKPSSKPIAEGDIFAERAAVDDELPEYDFGGKKFRIVSHAPYEYFVEEEKRNQGNLISDAKFNRNKTVEDRFNFEIVTAFSGPYTEVTPWVTKTVLSGADEFDLFCSHTASAGGIVTKNIFLNWYDIPNVDFSKPWWPDSNVEDLTYNGKCILAVSDFNYVAVSTAYCMLFNKNLANAYDMGNLYEVVMDGDWTFDYFYNLIKDVYIDEDGDGNRSEGDFYGFQQAFGYGCTISSWVWAFDNPTMKKDEDGIPAISVKTDKINIICTAIYDLCYNTNGVYYDHKNNSAPNLFYSKKAIFTISSIGAPTGEYLRNFEDEYGILPLPKWDEHQEKYISSAAAEHSVIAVPKTVKDTEFVGTCI
ncbi:MAG: hypothetical protein IIV81_00875, partial [Clostridia bacterium]|nr:hypothetical protein [Clostridia bacterium]